MANFANEKGEVNKQQVTRFSRNIWLFLLIPLFSLLILWQLYQWSQGRDEIGGAFLPLSFIFIGLSTITGSRNKSLYYLFLGLAVVSLAIAIVMMFIR